VTKPREVYKCLICGIVVETLEGGAGEPVCCGQPMQRMEEQTAEAAGEKHVPFIERLENGTVKVSVGKETAHPMEAKHYIQWIELSADGMVLRKHLQPTDAPEAVFAVTGGTLAARELCNVHGLWKNQA
jgi:superoxide reductase